MRFLHSELPRYFIASLLALAVDTGVLSACLRLLHLSLPWSATAGFVSGVLVAYVLSIRWVFRSRAFGSTPFPEFISFVAIGVVGLGITQAVLWVGVSRLGLLAEAVKLVAAMITFAFNFILRRALLFAGARNTDAVPGASP